MKMINCATWYFSLTELVIIFATLSRGQIDPKRKYMQFIHAFITFDTVPSLILFFLKKRDLNQNNAQSNSR